MLIPIENKTNTPKYVGGFLILPGETRLLDSSLLPSHLRPAPERAPAAPEADAASELSAKSIAEIREAVAGLTSGQMDKLVALEAAKEKPRSGVADAVTREKLRRAEAAAKLEDFNRAVAAMDGTQLRAYRENVAAHPELIAAVDEALAALDANQSVEDEAP
jgi:hypothetical protein